MLFKKGSALYATEMERRQGEDVLYINTIGAPFVPSIAENSSVMSRSIDFLTENPNVSRLIFVQQRNYSYPANQILLLAEIARIYNFLVKQEEILSPKRLSLYGRASQAAEDLQYLLILLKQNPIGCYVELRKRIKNLKEQLQKINSTSQSAQINYLRTIEKFFNLLDSTKLIQNSRDEITESSFKSREIYFGYEGEHYRVSRTRGFVF